MKKTRALAACAVLALTFAACGDDDDDGGDDTTVTEDTAADLGADTTG